MCACVRMCAHVYVRTRVCACACMCLCNRKKHHKVKERAICGDNVRVGLSIKRVISCVSVRSLSNRKSHFFYISYESVMSRAYQMCILLLLIILVLFPIERVISFMSRMHESCLTFRV